MASDLAAVRARQGDKDAARGDLAAALAVFSAANAPKRAAQAHEVARAFAIALEESRLG